MTNTMVVLLQHQRRSSLLLFLFRMVPLLLTWQLPSDSYYRGGSSGGYCNGYTTPTPTTSVRQVLHRYSNSATVQHQSYLSSSSSSPSNKRHQTKLPYSCNTRNIVRKRMTPPPQTEPSMTLFWMSSTTTTTTSICSSSTSDDDSSDNSRLVDRKDSTPNGVSINSSNIWSKWKQWFQQRRQSIASMYKKTNENEDKLTFRQRLAKMGLATILSYGFVSNMSYAVTVSCAWYIHNVQTKMSPLCPGQWKPFLLIYSGFFIFNNIVRPIRLGISMAVVAPQCDRLLQYIQTQYRVSRTVAIAITVVMANVVGTISAMSLGIVMASILSGVPIFP